MKEVNQNHYIKIDEATTQTAVIKMENQKNRTTVDLVGAIHVGSPLYYQKIFSLLQEKDIVLYEMCGIGEAPDSCKKYLLFVEKIGLKKLYKEVADIASHYFSKKREQKLFPKLDEVLSTLDMLDKNEKIANTSIPDLKKLIANLKIRNEVDKYDERLSVVFQGDSIDYTHLPTNRKHADLTKQELYSTMGVFSWENLLFFNIRILLPRMRKHGGIDRLAHAIVAGELDSSMLPVKKKKSNLHQRRENKIYDLIQCYEKTVESIGVFYGAAHLPAIEAHLQDQGYITKNINYLEAIRSGGETFEMNKIISEWERKKGR